MRRFKFAKLVRDRIVEGIIAAGNTPIYRVLEHDEYIEALKKKLVEEAAEIPHETRKEKLVEEITDVQEVLDALSEALQVSKEEIHKEQQKKNQKAGSFKKHLYIDIVEVHEDSPWQEHYSSQPEKYPEIK